MWLVGEVDKVVEGRLQVGMSEEDMHMVEEEVDSKEMVDKLLDLVGTRDMKAYLNKELLEKGNELLAVEHCNLWHVVQLVPYRVVQMVQHLLHVSAFDQQFFFFFEFPSRIVL